MLHLIYFLLVLSSAKFKAKLRKNDRVFTCEHDKEYPFDLRSEIPTRLKKDDQEPIDEEIIKNEVDSRQEIRVKFDVSTITIGDNRNKDNMQCKPGEEGIVKPWSKASACQAEDVLTEDKVAVITKTIDAAANYITRLINVTRKESGISRQELINVAKGGSIGWGEAEALLPEGEYQDCDLYIFVLARPYGSTSNTLASAAADRFMGRNESTPLDFNRPYIGHIYVNVAKLPQKPQDETSGDRQFFITVMHELMHILSFAGSLFPRWNDRRTGRTYTQPTVKFFNNYKIEQSFIATPGLQNWVFERFQVIQPELKQLGLELEDGGGSGTAGSHPNSRLYFTDLMQGKTYGPGYFSLIYFNSLQDSGWYEANFELNETLPYLDPNFVEEPLNQYLLTEAPRDIFPKSLFCTNNNKNYCYYDHKFKGVCDSYDIDYIKSVLKDSPTEAHIINESSFTTWYGGPNNKYSDEFLFDYMPVLFPNNALNCQDPDAPAKSDEAAKFQSKMSETYGKSSICVMSTIFKQSLTEMSIGENPGCYKARCGEDNKLRITLPGTAEQICHRQGQHLFKKGSTNYAVCPKAAIACANFAKTPMVAITSALPDRGPYDGKNYLAFLGLQLKKYNITSISIGNVVKFTPADFLDYTDDRILVKMPANIQDKAKSVIGRTLSLEIEVENPPKAEDGTPFNGHIEDIYTFLDRKYSTG